MGILWYAIGIYMIGVAIVLYIRPQVMFRENGMWKEFGLATDADQTIFPFWMFAIIWSILSYALANLLSIFFASVALASESPLTATATTAIAANATFMQPISSYPNTNATTATTVTATTAAPATPTMSSRTPGYYILDPYANPAQPRYIYYGAEPPGFTQAAN